MPSARSEPASRADVPAGYHRPMTDRALLRRALTADESLRTFAPTDDDLIALRDELPALGGG